MKIIVLSLVAVILCGMSSSASADGKKLLEYCRAADYYLNEGEFNKEGDHIKAGFCMGIVEGVGSTMDILSKDEALSNVYRVCFPEDGITGHQAVRVVVKYLLNHPQDMHHSEVMLVMVAFLDAYPCEYA